MLWSLFWMTACLLFADITVSVMTHLPSATASSAYCRRHKPRARFNSPRCLPFTIWTRTSPAMMPRLLFRPMLNNDGLGAFAILVAAKRLLRQNGEESASALTKLGPPIVERFAVAIDARSRHLPT